MRASSVMMSQTRHVRWTWYEYVMRSKHRGTVRTGYETDQDAGPIMCCAALEEEGGGGSGKETYVAAGDYGGKVQVWGVSQGGTRVRTVAHTG